MQPSDEVPQAHWLARQESPRCEATQSIVQSPQWRGSVRSAAHTTVPSGSAQQLSPAPQVELAHGPGVAPRVPAAGVEGGVGPRVRGRRRVARGGDRGEDDPRDARPHASSVEPRDGGRTQHEERRRPESNR
ncbi:MAG: hypothetical protein M5U28_53875 [Sandaracinaceae bacterium]|nr:hypothetical protein [Sandaracinaceae bacterium]